jgi:hypothetical protein
MDPVVHFEMPFDTRRESDWNAGSNARYLRNGGIDRRALHPGDGKSITAWAGKEKAQDRLSCWAEAFKDWEEEKRFERGFTMRRL